MIKRLLACVCALMLASAHATESTGTPTSATFTASAIDATPITNPERGWGHHLQGGSGNIMGSIDTSLFATALTNNTRLGMCYFDLSAYRTNSDLSAAIPTIQARLATVRSNGFKCVFMAFYNFSGTGLDATKDITVSHIGQLRTTFRTYADTIAYVKLGFIGAYGEAAASSNCNSYYGTIASGCTLAVANANYTAIKDAMLAAVHPLTAVQVRNPQMLYSYWYPSVLTNNEKYNGTAKSRTGIFNDCLLSGSFAYNGTGTQDTGTWQGGQPTVSETALRTYAGTVSDYVPYGGELSTSCAPPLRVLCNETYGVLADFASFNLTWMKGPNFQTTTYTDSWNTGGCRTTVYNRIGYRLIYNGISHQSTATAGQTITATVTMHNIGYARVHYPRKVQLVMVRQGGGASDIVCSSRVDLRAIPPQSATPMTISIPCTTGIAGTWNVHLRIPDIWPNTAGTAAFAIRPANTDSGGQAWDATNFRFTTGTTVVVS